MTRTYAQVWRAIRDQAMEEYLRVFDEEATRLCTGKTRSGRGENITVRHGARQPEAMLPQIGGRWRD
jgi:hypothetical protein